MKKETKIKRKYTKKSVEPVKSDEININLCKDSQRESLETIGIHLAQKSDTDVSLWANDICRSSEGIIKSLVYSIVIGDKKFIKQWKKTFDDLLLELTNVISKFEKEYKKGKKKCSTK